MGKAIWALKKRWDFNRGGKDSKGRRIHKNKGIEMWEYFLGGISVAGGAADEEGKGELKAIETLILETLRNQGFQEGGKGSL